MRSNKPHSRKVNPRQFKRSLQSAMLQLHRAGTRLCQMHGKQGAVWFLVPGGIVDNDVARALIALPNVAGNPDALFPNMSQTWQVISTTSTAAA